MESKIDTILDNYRNAGRDQLIPVLQEIQNEEGYISQEAVQKVGERLSLPASKIYGVATFYNQFRFEPVGRYHIQVCRGTACHVLGSSTVLETLEKELKIRAGKTSHDGLFSIEIVACIGACGLAPVVAINGEFHAKLNQETIKNIIESYRKREVE